MNVKVIGVWDIAEKKPLKIRVLEKVSIFPILF